MKSKIIKGIQQEPHFQSEIKIIFVIEGSLEATVKQTKYKLKKNDIILFNSCVCHAVSAPKDTIVCVVSYSCELICKVTSKDDCIFSCNSVIEDNSNYKELREIFRQIVYQYVYKHKTDCLKDSLLYKLLNCRKL